MVITLDTSRLTNPVVRILRRARQGLRARLPAGDLSAANAELQDYVKDLTLIVDNLSSEVERLREQLNTRED